MLSLILRYAQIITIKFVCKARRSRQRVTQTDNAVESCAAVHSVTYMPEVYKISMVRIIERFDELANVQV